MHRKTAAVAVLLAIGAVGPAAIGAQAASREAVTLRVAVRLADGSAGDPLKIELPGIEHSSFKVRFLSSSSVELRYPARRPCASTRVRASVGAVSDPTEIVRSALPDANREGIISDPRHARETGGTVAAWRALTGGSTAGGGPQITTRSLVVAGGTRNLPAPLGIRIDINCKTLRPDARCATVSRYSFGPGTSLLAPSLAAQDY